MTTVIGVVGPIGSGKSVLVKTLGQRGFFQISLSDRIREELKRQSLPITREWLQDMGDELRLNFGKDVLAVRTAEIIEEQKHGNVVIDSIRHPDEIRLLRERFGAKIIGVTASQWKRFENLQARNRTGDPVTFDEFSRMDGREMSGQTAPHAIQIQKCLEMADVVVINQESLGAFQLSIESALIQIGIEGPGIYKEREK